MSNRLPVTFHNGQDARQHRRSIGGLVTGIESYIARLSEQQAPYSSYLWVGWPGDFIEEENKPPLDKFCQEEYGYVPVYLDKQTIEEYYFGFCNEIIWPLFHFFPEHVRFRPELWEYYRTANEAFYHTLRQHLRADDVVWIQDYHLMLLPQLLRAEFPALAISFFLHIPFPAFDVFRHLPLPNRRLLLEGLLGADLLGFHTCGYVNNFIHSVYKTLHLAATNNEVTWLGRKVKADVYPMGIDYQAFHQLASTPACERSKTAIRQQFAGQKLLLSIDRLDYTKGVLNRLKAFEYLLQQQPAWQGKAVLLLLVAPSRREIPSYARLKEQIDECVGRINGQYGSSYWTPVIYQYRQIDLAELCALYGASDVALVTPLRDGMNLIAKEYIACQAEPNCVLILSEFAGAIDELAGALSVNPHHTQDLAAAMITALEMPVPEQAARCQRMQQRLREYDVHHWAQEILDATLAVRNGNVQHLAKPVDARVVAQLKSDFQRAKSSLLLFDYDGTLAPFASQPSQALPSPELLRLIRQLAVRENTTVVIISGRDKKTLSEWFAECEIAFSADLGAWVNSDGRWQLLEEFDQEWKSQLHPLLHKYSLRLPASYVEEKDYSLVWDYRLADPELRTLRTRQLVTEFSARKLEELKLTVLCGEHSLIIRNTGNTKGDAARHWLKQTTYDFILAVGDDDVDEELFAALPADAHTIRVGKADTRAEHFVLMQQQIIDLLASIAA